MHKSILFAAVGVTVFLAGCQDDVMNDVYYRPAPGGADIQQPAPEPIDTVVQADPAPAAPAVTTAKYVPMTDVVSSGGVDSAPGKKSAGKSGQYIVKRGDTPEKIARRHGVRLSALMSVNNLTQESARRLQIGQKLIIPGKSAKAAPVKSVKAVKSAKNPATTVPALEGGKYTIKSGDTPERIARRYKVKLSELLSANNLDEAAARRLQIGQKLIIPGKTENPAVTVDPVVPVAPPAPVENVVPDVQKEQLAVDNQQESKVPQVNSVDVQPVPTESTDDASNFIGVDVENDTTFAELAAKYGVSEAELRNNNSGIKDEIIKKGSFIIVPKKKN